MTSTCSPYPKEFEVMRSFIDEADLKAAAKQLVQRMTHEERDQ